MDCKQYLEFADSRGNDSANLQCFYGRSSGEMTSSSPPGRAQTYQHQLCRLLISAEDKIRGHRLLVKRSILPGIKKRKRSETPPERMASEDEAKYVTQEERATKRVAEKDLDFENKSISSSSD